MRSHYYNYNSAAGHERVRAICSSVFFARLRPGDPLVPMSIEDAWRRSRTAHHRSPKCTRQRAAPGSAFEYLPGMLRASTHPPRFHLHCFTASRLRSSPILNDDHEQVLRG